MQGMRRFFVPGTSIICAFDDANRQSFPREGVAALPYAEREISPKSGHTIQILRVGADLRVRPHRSALQFVIGRTRQRCPDFSKHRHQGRELALVQVRTA
ncbi:MAG: hypothetical protein RL169_1703 [Armatimonadota bacterium]